MDLHELQIEAIRNHLVAKAYIHSEERALILKEIISSASKRLFFPSFSACMYPIKLMSGEIQINRQVSDASILAEA